LRIPLHISGIWVPFEAGDLRSSGSIGAGINLTLYLEVIDYSTSDVCSISVNGRDVFRDHARYICGKTGIRVSARMRSLIEPGMGFAVSAAAVLAYCLLHASVVGRGFVEDYATLAHEAEVLYKTGLGDVPAIYYGGLEVRVKPGAPGIGVVKRIVVGFKPCLIACVLPGFESTPEMLNRLSREDYEYGEKLLRELVENPSLETFFEKAQLFTRRVFEYSAVDRAVEGYRSSIVGFFRKKQALVAWVERDRARDVAEHFEKILKAKCFEVTVDHMGVAQALASIYERV